MAGVALGWWIKGCDSPEEIIREVRDTVTVVQHRPQIVEKEVPFYVKGDPVVYRDTIRTDDGERDTVREFIAQPFELSMDTVEADGDTIAVQVRSPPPTISLAIAPAPDTTLERTNIVHIPPPPKPWYEEPAKAGVYIGGGFLAGYVTRLLTEESCQNRQPNQVANSTTPSLINISLSW